MLQNQIPNLYKARASFTQSKNEIVTQWISYSVVRATLNGHGISADTFASIYGGDVFEYFMDVIAGEKEIGDCPVMAKLLQFLKDRDISSDELFVICTHFRKSMIDFSYDSAVNTKGIFDEISYVFDLNFAGVLRMYAATVYEKEQEIVKNTTLLNEYRKAIDESAIVSKTDLNGIITYANDNLCDVCGYSRQELEGESHSIMRHEDMNSSFFQQLWTAISGHQIFKGTIKNRKKNGDYFYVDSTIVPITDPFNEITEYMAIGYEVTRLIDAREDAQRAGEAKDYFLSNMSHEIRTPLNAILGFVSLLKDEDISKKHQKYLNIIQNSGENLLSIINDILDFSKLRSGEFTVDSQFFNLHEELSHTLELFVPTANEKAITMLSFIDPLIPYELYSDALRIKQIVANFLSNAIKFTPVNGSIEVNAKYQNGVLIIEVIDTGIGISKEDQARVFDAFSQAQNSSTRMSGGTGLGLSICKQLAVHMGGNVNVRSQLGQGSTFTLSLPMRSNQTSALHMFDPTPFLKLRMGLLQEKDTPCDKLDSLKRYWSAFKLKTVTVNHLDDSLYDLLFFVDSEVSDATREEIKEHPVPAIAIMESLSDNYENDFNITPLHFPVYCSKLYNTFLEALNLSPDIDKKIVKATKHHHFKGYILVAEDNSANQELIKIVLERFGLDYFITANGQEVIDAYKVDHFDMILMDEQMPIKNGLDAAVEIIEYEKEQGKKHTPIVALTANVIKGAKERGLAMAYDEFLGKPVVIKEIEAVFLRYLEEIDKDVIAAEKVAENREATVLGMNVQMLQDELMLDDDQVVMLVRTYIKKMDTTMPELKDAIETRNYEEIKKLAHSVKGSSANFRIDTLQSMAKEMEAHAIKEDADYDYEAVYKALRREYDKIEIVG